jgi:hypothetical protein
MATLKIPELKQYIYRKLGHPVINVEVDDIQLDDCIDEALKTFVESHYDACEIGYVQVAVTAGASEYSLPDSIQEVLDCLNVEGSNSSMYFLSDEPLLLLRPGYGHGYELDFDVTSVEVWRQTAALWEETFKNHILFGFNTFTKTISFPEAPKASGTRVIKVVQAVGAGDDMIVDSLWLKNYAAALARIQWGVNLGKYDGAQLPGGVSINAAGILEKGEADKERLLIELDEKYTEPPDPVFA